VVNNLLGKIHLKFSTIVAYYSGCDTQWNNCCENWCLLHFRVTITIFKGKRSRWLGIFNRAGSRVEERNDFSSGGSSVISLKVIKGETKPEIGNDYVKNRDMKEKANGEIETVE